MNRSDFFIGRVNAGFRYIVASTCRLKGQAKTPREKRNRWDPAEA